MLVHSLETVKDISVEADSPSLALNCGHYIRQILLLKISLGVAEANEQMRKEGLDFKELYEGFWNSKISCIANRRKNLREINKEKKIPTTEDIIKLGQYLQREIQEIVDNKSSPSYQDMQSMAELLIVRLALFNKRRISEVDELKVSDYECRPKENSDPNLLNSMTVTEKALVNRMTVLEVRGKSTRGIRKVYILLTPDMCSGVEWLLKARKKLGVTSKYLFARKNGAFPLDGCTAMRNVTEKCPDLSDPKSIRTRTIRTYTATTSQILNMTNDELKMLADHMGHNINIHTDIYRLQTSLIEKTKVAKLLLASENGGVARFAGKSLDSISLEEIPLPVDYNDEWCPNQSNDEEQGNLESTSIVKTNESSIHTSEDITPDEEEENLEGTAIVNTNESSIQTNKTSVNTNVPFREHKPGGKRTWTKEEQDCLYKAFKSNIQNGKNVSSNEINNAMQKYKALAGRTEAIIRVKVNNIIKGKDKKIFQLLNTN